MPFLLRPRSLDGESLSSWRQRAGRANGYVWFPSFTGFSRQDPDRTSNGVEVKRVAEEFASTPEQLHELSIARFNGLGIGIHLGGQLTRWTSAHCLTKPAIGYGSGFCPMCLVTDSTPYFRLAWRLAFVTHCPIHHCRLHSVCPGCEHQCWPATYGSRGKFQAVWADFRYCPRCRADLGAIPPVLDNGHEASVSLLERVRSFEARRLVGDAFPEADYFLALWSTCRILGRRLDRFAHSGLMSALDGIQASYLRGETIEWQPIEVRQALVTSAKWMLEDWPSRFVETCKAGHISRADFGGTDGCSPHWFDKVVRVHLARSINWITADDVGSAIAQLKLEGLTVSKNALRRRLGVTESKAINDRLDQRRRATADEFETLCCRYHLILADTPPSRDQQRTLCRDYLMLLYSYFCGSRIEEICKWQQARVDESLERVRREFSTSELDQALIGRLLLELDYQYRYGVRPEFRFRGSEPTSSWFVSRFGRAMDGHSIRARFAEIMGGLFGSALWNSVDVFCGVGIFPGADGASTK